MHERVSIVLSDGRCVLVLTVIIKDIGTIHLEQVVTSFDSSKETWIGVFNDALFTKFLHQSVTF